MSHTTSTAPPEALSPGILVSTSQQVRAYELKFLLSEARAQEVERWAVAHMVPDPHAEPGLGNAYRVTSLYLDTPGLDVFHRVPPHHRRKMRLRGYAATSTLFLEQKSRRGDRIRKRRTPIADADLVRLRQFTHEKRGPNGRWDDWPGAWFQERLIARALRPTLQIGCVRSAFFGEAAEGPMRVTLDRHLHGVPNHDWPLLSTQGGPPLLDGQVVLELKYRNAVPTLFKRLLVEMALNPCPVSKYRLAMRAWNPGNESHPVG